MYSPREEGEEQYGFDANFVVEVADSLKCVVCHLVMRKPVQFMACGHRVCKPCFDRYKGYSQHMRTELLCPVDREPIDINKVFDDIGIGRDIGNLQITCSNAERGCNWIGDLRDGSKHQSECQYCIEGLQRSAIGMEVVTPDLVKELCCRMAKCEEAISMKEKDIAYLKYNMHELKKTLDKNVEEICFLKDRNKEIEEEMKTMKEKNAELQQFEKDLKISTLKHQLLEKKVEASESQVQLSVNTLENQNVEMQSMQREIKNVKDMLTEKNNVEGIDAIDNKVKKVEDVVGYATNQMKQTEARFNDSLQTTTDEITKLSEQLTSVEKQVKNNFNSLSTKINEEIKKMGKSQTKGKPVEDIDDLREHISNIENILFFTNDSNDIVLQWKLQNYQYHFDMDERVVSPQFDVQLNGFCCKLMILWTGDKKEKFGLFLKSCCGKNYNENTEPFGMAYKLQMIGKNGEVKTKSVPASYKDAKKEVERKKYLVISPDENESIGFGFGSFLTAPEVEDYVVNDMVSVKCILTP